MDDDGQHVRASCCCAWGMGTVGHGMRRLPGVDMLGWFGREWREGCGDGAQGTAVGVYLREVRLEGVMPCWCRAYRILCTVLSLLVLHQYDTVSVQSLRTSYILQLTASLRSIPQASPAR